jgi:LCP family protein required for cell wall assembly
MPTSVRTLAPEDPGVGAQPSPRKPRRSTRQRVLLGLGVVVVLAILMAVAGVGYAIWRFSQLRTEKLNLASASSGGPQNYLIVGSDSRSGISKSDPDYAVFNGDGTATGGQRSDTIMVLRIDPSKRTAKLLSFPRDLWIPIYGTGGNQRINTAYSNGAQPLIYTIEQDFGIPINHYVEVNFNSFRDVVNAVGGVPMYFQTKMRDQNSGLDIEHAGCVKLNGDQALSFARSRELEYYDTQLGEWKYDGTGDLGRITRQQIFIRKVIGRAEAKATGLNLLATNNLVHNVIKNLKVDSSFSFTDMLALLGEFKLFDSNKLQTYSLPTTPHVTDGGADVLLLQSAKAQPILDLFRSSSSQSSKVKPADVTLSVQNGGGVTGAAGRASSALQGFGFKVSGTGNADAQSTTTVLYGPSAQAQAELVSRYVQGGAELSQDSSLGSSQVELVIGSDFQGIVTTAPGSHSTSTSQQSTTTTTTPIGLSVGIPPKGVSC